MQCYGRNMRAPEEDPANALTVREVAAISEVAPRTIRRKVAEGAFPHAFRVSGEEAVSAGRWRVPTEDVERGPVALNETSRPRRAPAQPEVEAPLSTTSVPRALELRLALAEAVADAELATLRKETEKWQAIALERERALERADAALNALAGALRVVSRQFEASEDIGPDGVPVVRWPPTQRHAPSSVERSQRNLSRDDVS